MARGARQISRRSLLAGLGTGVAAALHGQSGARSAPKGTGVLPRATPPICIYSESLKVDYNDVGPFVQAIGFEGVELAVVPGGHIPLEGDIDLHLERAVEAMTGSGLEVPVLSTTITSVQSKELRTIVGWGNEMGVPMFSPGQWPNRGDGMASVVAAQREISMLGAMGQAAKMQIAVHNATPNFVGSSIADLNAAIRPFGPIIGFNFDVGYAAAYSGDLGAALDLALPRLKMATARDCKWTKADDGSQTLTQCPLGEGMVDWQRFFGGLAKANFTGPITVRLEYELKDDLAAARKDLAFLKKLRTAAYGG